MRYLVKSGLGTILDSAGRPRLMTETQARRYAERNMPRDLARAGFRASIARIPNWIANPGAPDSSAIAYLRVCYGK